ncbi:MAG: alkaline phosphatase PhoX [Actinomycetota bacterium]
MDRRRFLAAAGAAVGGAALAGPLSALMARVAGAEPIISPGYGPLVPMGDLRLPAGFSYKIVQRQGDLMTPVDAATGVPSSGGVSHPTPSRFDGMAAFPGPDGSTILMRNHENKKRYNFPRGVATPVIPGNEIDVIVPEDKRYDSFYNGGVVKLTIKDGNVLESYAVIAGTTHNCAGGLTPWHSWLTCEEFFQTNPTAPNVAHGYVFDIPVSANGPVTPLPIVAAGRFEHEAVAWSNGALYETEDAPDASFYRYRPTNPNNLLAGGTLEALRLIDFPGRDTRLGGSWPGPVGSAFAAEWVPIADPNPSVNTGTPSVRGQAQAQGAAIFARLEGIWSVQGKIYFDATTGGGTSVLPNTDGLGFGQVYEYDPVLGTLRLVFEATKTAPFALVRPDNLAPHLLTSTIYLCEDNQGSEPASTNHVRGLTPKGTIFDFAEGVTNTTEFAGVCFSPDGQTMFLNQHGNNSTQGGVTYAITGPWKNFVKPSPTPSPSTPLH